MAEYFFIDATYKMAPTGFAQLLTVIISSIYFFAFSTSFVFTSMLQVNTFIQAADGNIVQIPLCAVFMSRRRKEDYCAVLKCLLKNMLVVNNWIHWQISNNVTETYLNVFAEFRKRGTHGLRIRALGGSGGCYAPSQASRLLFPLETGRSKNGSDTF